MTGSSSIDTGRERSAAGRSPLVAGLLACAFVVALVAGAASLALAAGETPSSASPVASAAFSPTSPTAVNATPPPPTASSQTTQTDAVVQGVGISGEAVAARADGTVYLWQSRPYSLTVTVGQIATAGEYRVCALTEAVELDCTTASLGPATDGEVDLGSVKSTPIGAQNVTVTLARVGANETVVASQFLRIHVLSPAGDFDADGLSNRAERDAGTDPTTADTDRDLLGDGTEASLGTDPTNPRTAVGFAVAAMVALGVVVALVSRYAPGTVGALRRLSGGPRSGPTSASKPAESELTKSAMAESSPTSSDRRGSGATARGDGRGSVSTDGERATDAEIRDDPTPPLSDRERVIQLLEDNDGKLPQSDIVSETPWSKSKVSRLLARMDAQGQVVKVSAGRQNIIVLPGEEPVELQSLRDDERD